MVTTLGGCGCCGCSSCADGNIPSAINLIIAGGTGVTATISGSSTTVSPLTVLNGTHSLTLIYHNGVYATGYDYEDLGDVDDILLDGTCYAVFEVEIDYGDLFTGSTFDSLADETRWFRGTTVRFRVAVGFISSTRVSVTVYSMEPSNNPASPPITWTHYPVWEGTSSPAPEAPLDWYCDCAEPAESLDYNGSSGDMLSVIAYSADGSDTNVGGQYSNSVLCTSATMTYTAPTAEVTSNCTRVNGVS